MTNLVERLHAEGCSCVIFNHGEVSCCRERGVRDLLHLLKTDRSRLDGAAVADKVVGKGAAALMLLGGVKAVYADVISEPALELFEGSGVEVSFGKRVPNIINRAGTGVCPVETLCRDCLTAEECLPLIERFVEEMSRKNK
ncbi:MAG: DUF1893 domain-containing protein [Duncaniella sp.]|nr:DUF1893 domain-containing protein [Duncaniella sp.]